MLATLILAMTMIGGDPVSGWPLYTPAIGEKAVLHYYDAELGKAHPWVEVWTNTTALSKFAEGMESEECERERAMIVDKLKEYVVALERRKESLLLENAAYLRERTKVLGNPKALDALDRRQKEALLKKVESYKRDDAKNEENVKELDALIERQRKALLIEPEKRNEVIDLDDMTPLRVRALARFFKPDKPAFVRNAISPDYVLVEALDGRGKGHFFWTTKDNVRVPTSKPPEPGDFFKFGIGAVPPMDKPTAVLSPDPDPAPRPPATMLLVEGSSWNKPLDGFVQVHCRVKNTSGKALKFVIATVVFEDAAGNLVHSAKMIVGDLQPGDTKTVTSFDKHDARMDHYKFEFEGQDDSGKDRVLDFTTAGKKGAVGRR